MGPRQIKWMRVRTENCWRCKSTVEICMYVDDSKKRPWGATSSFHASLDHTTTYYGVLDFFGYVLLICLKETGRIAWLPKPYPYTLPYLSHSPSIFCLYRQVLFLQLRDSVNMRTAAAHLYWENQTQRFKQPGWAGQIRWRLTISNPRVRKTSLLEWQVEREQRRSHCT